MKKIAPIALALFLIFFYAFSAKAQTPAGWMRVTSDNKEFSAEVPAQYDFFYDEEGFIVSDGMARSFVLEDVHIFSGFREKTLISFECYETESAGADAVMDIDKQKMKVSEVTRSSYKIKQITNKDSEHYLIRQYFRSKNYLYIITAASREGETVAIRRFLDSIVFDPTIAAAKQKKSNFSALKLSKIDITVNEDAKYKTPSSASSKTDDPTITPVKVISKPRTSYVDSARARGVQGAIAMKVDLNTNGFIPKFAVVKSLPEGLLRQAVFAAFRVRFLPSEKSGVARTVTKTIEYHFKLY